MQPKIIFLGTGGARFVIANQFRATGGIVLQYDDEQIHIDPGPGTLIRAKQYGIDLKNNTILLVSHNHIDHCNDINAVIDVMTQGEITKKGILITTKTIIQGSKDETPYLTTHHSKCVKRIIIAETGKITKINDLSIIPTKAKHDNTDSVGFKIITPKFTLGYTADTEYFRGIEKEYKGCDIMIINNLRSFGKKYKGHFSSAETVKLLQKVKPKLAIIQHFGMTMLKANPMYEAREITKQSGVQTVAATDGMHIDPISYSARSNQKTLSGY